MRTCTLRDLLPEGAAAGPKRDPAVAALKETAGLVRGIEAGVRFYEQPPTEATKAETPWGDITIEPARTGPRPSAWSSPGRRTTRPAR